MKREIQVTISLIVEADGAEGWLLEKDLHKTYSIEPLTHFGYPDIAGIEISETTHPADIAQSIAADLSNALGKSVYYRYEGDNGENDIGYEYRTNDGILFDLGITKRKGIWDISIERNEEEIPIGSIDDLVELTQKPKIRVDSRYSDDPPEEDWTPFPKASIKRSFDKDFPI